MLSRFTMIKCAVNLCKPIKNKLDMTSLVWKCVVHTRTLFAFPTIYQLVPITILSVKMNEDPVWRILWNCDNDTRVKGTPMGNYVADL